MELKKAARKGLIEQNCVRFMGRSMNAGGELCFCIPAPDFKEEHDFDRILEEPK